jgi:hypothetical protein
MRRRVTASGEHHTPMSFHSAEQQENVALKGILQEYVSLVSDVLEVCCKCFIWMVQK